MTMLASTVLIRRQAVTPSLDRKVLEQVIFFDRSLSVAIRVLAEVIMLAAVMIFNVVASLDVDVNVL